MARKEIELKIEDGRDAGKVFKITELPAVQMDKWTTRALLLLGKSGMNIGALSRMTVPDILAALSKADYDETEKLLEVMLESCSFEKDGVSVSMKGAMVDSVIEEWTTIFKLRVEAIKLNLGFLEPDAESASK